jgi:predicted PurR-regulated permease PerM
MKNLKTTNILLLLIAIPIVFFVLKTLSFIFIPLVLSMFIALLFLPLMRWLQKKRVPKTASIILIIVLISVILKTGGELIQLASKQILTADKSTFANVEEKLIGLIALIEDFFGIKSNHSEGNVLWHYIQKLHIDEKFGSVLDYIGNTLSMTLMTVFFSILWLSESINFQKLLNTTIIKQRYVSVKVFRRIEKDLIKFIVVKVFVSLFTGVFFALVSWGFDISFPVFWGLFAFIINFIQMIGSFISIGTLSLFGLAELDPTGSFLLFVLLLTAIQGLIGGIVEPVLMGKSFSINVISILVMLMFWGYIWGIAGMVMSIPITVFVKIILEHFKSTRIAAEILSGSEFNIGLSINKLKRK